MLDQLLQASEALRTANRTGRLAGVLIPAMYGCPECRLVWVIVSPAQPGVCADCGMPLTVLTADQVAALASGPSGLN